MDGSLPAIAGRTLGRKKHHLMRCVVGIQEWNRPAYLERDHAHIGRERERDITPGRKNSVLRAILRELP